MRKDITLEKILGKEEIKVNKSELARQHGCCWETIDRRLNPDKYKKETRKRIYTSKLDPFKNIINQKLELTNVPATGIYYLLKHKYNFQGKYGIVRKYVHDKKKKIIDDLTIRFETIKGYQSQVDWKESVKLHDINNNEYKINIFLIVLGYSRYKYIELTFDKTKPTLFKCLNNAFKYYGGTTEEILFDNMKTVVDHTKSTFTNTIINQETEQFSKDAGFRIVTCRPFKPRTKGKVETLAKIMNRLKAYDFEFKNKDELYLIINTLMEDLNYHEKSQATNEYPYKRFKEEKKYLIHVNNQLLDSYCKPTKTYKVSKESMITYHGIKYSVPIKYVGKLLNVSEDNESIHIYYITDLICSYKKNSKFRYNYKKDDYIDILKHSAFKDDDELNRYIENNLNYLNGINIEEE